MAAPAEGTNSLSQPPEEVHSLDADEEGLVTPSAMAQDHEAATPALNWQPKMRREHPHRKPDVPFSDGHVPDSATSERIALTEAAENRRKRKASEYPDEEKALAESKMSKQTDVDSRTAAVWLGFSVATVRRLIRLGNLEAFKTRPKRITVASLKNYKASLRQVCLTAGGLSG